MKVLNIVMFWILKRCFAGAMVLSALGAFMGISFALGSLFYWGITHPVPGSILTCFVIGYLCLTPEKGRSGDGVAIFKSRIA